MSVTQLPFKNIDFKGTILDDCAFATRMAEPQNPKNNYAFCKKLIYLNMRK